MRFVLDNDVDAIVAQWIKQQGHDCWTANQAHYADASDNSVSVYAQDKGAVLVSHDNEFAHTRMKKTIGRHLWLDCEQPDALGVLEPHWLAALELLEAREHVVVKVSRNRVRAFSNW